ncbi:MAG: cysteine rich repeat-containing protein [Rhodomicrobium sp.]
MIRALVPAAVAAALCFGAAIAGAEQTVAHSGSPEEQAACTPDVFRLCAAQIPSESRIVACLKQNKARLSPACRKVFS